jgi:hypothetical protein
MPWPNQAKDNHQAVSWSIARPEPGIEIFSGLALGNMARVETARREDVNFRETSLF